MWLHIKSSTVNETGTILSLPDFVSPFRFLPHHILNSQPANLSRLIPDTAARIVIILAAVFSS